LAALYHVKGQCTKAEPFYTRALKLSEKAEAYLAVAGIDWWRKQYRPRVSGYIDILLRSGKCGKALKVAEKYRCEELIALLRQGRPVIDFFTEAERREYYTYLRRIRWLLSKLGDRPGGDKLRGAFLPLEDLPIETDPAKRKAMVAELESLGDKVRALEMKYIPALAASRESPSLTELRSALEPGQAAIEYAMLPDGVAGFVLTKAHLQGQRLKVALHEFQELVGAARQAMAACARNEGAAIDSNTREVLQRLYQIHVEPLLEYLPKRSGPRNLVIVPCDILANLPWWALISDNSGKRPRYLIDDAVVRVVPSLRTLSFMRSLKHGAEPLELRKVLCIADPVGEFARIPRSSKEVQAIVGMAGRGSAAHTRCNALKKHLRRTRGVEVVHLATHGSFNELLPEASRLLFSPSDSAKAEALAAIQEESDTRGGRACADQALSDDDLTMRDVFELKLKDTKLLTLSACEVGQVNAEELEQFQGFIAGAVTAGCPNTIAALWRVNDEATELLMVRMYKEMHDAHACGNPLSVGAALRKAALWLRDECWSVGGLSTSAKYSHPYFWAPFQLYGCS